MTNKCLPITSLYLYILGGGGKVRLETARRINVILVLHTLNYLLLFFIKEIIGVW